MVQRGLDDEGHPLLRENVRACHVARGRHGEEDGSEVRDKRLEERVALRGEFWGKSGIRSERFGIIVRRLVLVEVRRDGIEQGLADLGQPKLGRGIASMLGVLTEGMSYCTESARASSACADRRNASGCAGNNASSRLFTSACMDGKSSCCFDDTFRRAANLPNDVKSSRTLR